MTMSTSENCKDGASKSNDGICEVNNMLQNMNTVSVCANCGKENSTDNMNMCNKCKQVRYCNAACKKKHRHKHKKDCEEHIRLATENEAKLHDEKLFKPPLPAEDCPICFLRLPTLDKGRRYYACCGKVICSGCIHAPLYDNQGNEVVEKTCPFCRTPHPKTIEEILEREKKRMELNDPIAIYNKGMYYQDGRNGFPQDYTKAFELWHQAGELGYTLAYNNIGYAYDHGSGVEVDEKKAIHYFELAAMQGEAQARHNLGVNEEDAGNFDRALKHHKIAVRGGYSNSLNEIKQLYTIGQASKDDYMKALQLYQVYLGEIKSVQRDKAAAASDEYRYH